VFLKGIETAVVSNKSLDVEIADSGIGIPQDKLNTIFEAFEQAHGSKRDGAGLGLAITKRLIDLLDGAISVSSTVGKGSNFSLRIPIKQVPTPLLAAQSDPHTSHDADASCDLEERLSRLQILVVDDNDINLKLMHGILTKQGMQCDLANSGALSLQKLHEKDYEIVFLDIQVPEMDGIEVLKKIRSSEKTKSLFVIALTANAMEEVTKSISSWALTNILPSQYYRNCYVRSLSPIPLKLSSFIIEM